MLIQLGFDPSRIKCAGETGDAISAVMDGYLYANTVSLRPE
jgi:hypothetical protein